MTNGLLLRDVIDDDLPIFYEQQSDSAAIHMVAFAARHPLDRDAFAAKWDRIRRDDTVAARTIVVDGQVVGNVLSFVAPESGMREVGYWIGKQHWGQGIATRALTEFLTHADATRPLFATAAKDNLRSLRVLEKCGFTILREAKEFAPARDAEIDELVLELRGGESTEMPPASCAAHQQRCEETSPKCVLGAIVLPNAPPASGYCFLPSRLAETGAGG